MKFLITTITLSLVFFLSGCGDTFSGSSEEAFKISKDLIIRKLNESEKNDLEKAMRVLAMRAMQEKWQDRKKSNKKSINQILLETMDNKNYSDVIQIAEGYLKNENETEVEQLKDEIAQLQKEKIEASKLIDKLKIIKISDIMVIHAEGSKDSPKLQITLTNTGNTDLVGKTHFKVEVNSITQKKQVTSYNGKGTIVSSDDYYIHRHSLAYLMDLSRELTAKLKKASYPITDLSGLDLDVKVTVIKITTTDGQEYKHPRKGLDFHESSINELKKKLKFKESLEGKLSELSITDEKLLANEKFNEHWTAEIESIRTRTPRNTLNDQVVTIDNNLSFTLPSHYKFLKKKSPGIYSMTLSDSLTFDNQDKDLLQYQIQDSNYREYVRDSDKANGTFNILKKPSAKFNIKKRLEEWKTPVNSLVEADDSGYIIYRIKYELTRYFEINGTHYMYSMDFSNLEECILEFDRSKNMLILK